VTITEAEVKFEKGDHTIYIIPSDSLMEGRSQKKLDKYGPIPCPEIEIAIYKSSKRSILIRQPKIQDAWMVVSREQWKALKELINTPNKAS